ncbi:MAG: DEAD/DEAH box helicase [Rhodobacteraceae bacterium]|nr:DEAD/DEAH box helicase [Paracoccaceae bacterium]
MQLRQRQSLLVGRASKALIKRNNTLAVAPTGAGKTVMLAAVASRHPDATTAILQHREELVQQNRNTFRRYTEGEETSRYTANEKVWSKNTFAMAQTLVQNLDQIPAVDFLGIDEAHHCVSSSYLKIIDAFKKANPNVEIYGTTATSMRGDNRRLTAVFDNCCDQITVGELIREGHLVPPRCFVVDLGVQKALGGVRRTAQDFDMSEVEAIMDKKILNERIVEEWSAKGGDRKTVVFCSTVGHANHVAEAFINKGFRAAVIWGDMPSRQRAQTLRDFERGTIQVLVNVAVLTEGWDCQPCSCVILLRPSSFKSTMIQMIGRGLRKIDPELFPGVIKDDCLVLDFGISLLTHGDIEDEDYSGSGGTKKCTACKAVVPKQSKDCPLCGYEWPQDAEYIKLCPSCEAENPRGAQVCCECPHVFSASDEPIEIEKFVLTEIDILNTSPFRYTETMGGACLMASAFTAYACVINYRGRFYAIGGRITDKGRATYVLANVGDRVLAIQSADDFLLKHGDKKAARKSKSWMKSQPSDKQLQLLNIPKSHAFVINKYEASCLLDFKFNERFIRTKIEQASGSSIAA